MNGKVYHIHLNESWTAMWVDVLDDNGNKTYDGEMVYDNAILNLELHGKWLGVLSATLYDKCTSYHLINLERLISGISEFDVYVGGERHGWFKDVEPLDFKIDFPSETITRGDDIMTFDDFFKDYYEDA